MNANTSDLRSSSLALLLPVLDYLEHLLAAVAGIDVRVLHAHADLSAGVRFQQPLQQEVLHQYADEDTAVTAILLLRRVVHRYVTQLPPKQSLHLPGCAPRLPVITSRHGVIVESYTVNDGDQ